MIGHNGYSFDDVVQENLECGLYWAQRDCLIRAVRDPELSHRHRIVIAEIIAMTNAESGVAYPGRKHLAAATGYTEGTIATTIKELVALGYIISDRRAPENGTRALAHYAIVKPTSDELRAAIDAHISFIRAASDGKAEIGRPWSKVNNGVHVNTPPDVNPSVHVNGVDVNNGVHVNDRIAEATPKADVNPVVPTVTSLDINLEDRPVSNLEIGRAKRLADDWKLPRSWGTWAAEHFQISRDEILSEAAAFKDHWIGTGNTRNATKKNWEATWRNWIRNSRKRYRILKAETEAAADLGVTTKSISQADAVALRQLDAIVSGGR